MTKPPYCANRSIKFIIMRDFVEWEIGVGVLGYWGLGVLGIGDG